MNTASSALEFWPPIGWGSASATKSMARSRSPQRMSVRSPPIAPYTKLLWMCRPRIFGEFDSVADHLLPALRQAWMPSVPNEGAMDAARVLQAVRDDLRYRGQIVHEQRFFPRPARYGALRHPLHATLTHALGRRGIA